MARQCGTCTLCCKVMGIGELDKPLGVWCPHCLPGKGCAIYDGRPAECRTFNCDWLVNERLGPEWKPERSKIVLVHRDGRIIAHVDPATPSAWRKSPYAEGLEAMMRAALDRNEMLYIAVNRHHILLLPGREVDLGPLAVDDEVLLKLVRKPGGVDYQVQVRKGASRQP